MTNDYIRREDALDAFNRAVQDVGILDADDIETVFGMLSSADVVQVVHARWVKPKGMMPPEHHGHYECSKCGTWAGRDWLRPWKEILLTDFCPGCGAKMDGERKE